MITNREVDIRVNHYGIRATVPVVQYDSGRQIIFNIVDADVPTGSTAKIFIRKPSGKSVYNTCSVSGNSVTAALTNQSLAEYGINYAQIQIENAGEVVTCFDVIFDVKRSHADGAEESRSESTFFQNLASEAQSAAGTAPNAVQINYLYNFEQGSYSSITGGYKKVDSTNTLRTIVPFFCKEGITLSALSGSQIIMQRFDMDFNYVGRTSFVDSYTADDDYYIFLAMHKTDSSNISVSDVPEILTSGTIDIITHNAVQSKYTDELFAGIEAPIIANTYSNYLYNFEQGSYSSITGGYKKVDSATMLRTIVPFFCGKGTKLSALSGSQIIMQRFDTDFNYVSKSTFLNNYTADADYYIFLAMHKNDESEIRISNIAEILTSETIDIINHNAVLSKYNDNGSIEPTLIGKYIANNVAIGVKVEIAPTNYDSFSCLYLDCSEGDQFTVTGTAGNSGRLWSFVDANGYLISKSNNVSYEQGLVLTAPANSSRVIFNFNNDYPHSLFKGNHSVLDRSFKKLSIPQAFVRDTDTAIVSPKLAYKAKIQENAGVSGAKTAIFKNGNYFCISYGENLDGNATDYPKVTTSGVLKIAYKFFKFENEVESDISYGTIAQKGTSYIDYTGAQKTFVGGCGLPSGRNGKQFFTSAFTGEHRYNGFENYGMTPCVCDISVSGSGVTVGQIRELILVIDGVSGKFDLTRIGAENVDYNLYLTTAPPVYSNGIWHWMQPLKHGLLYLTSTDAITWTSKFILQTEFDPCCEVPIVMYDGYILAAVRTWGSSQIKYTSSTMYLLLINSGGFISHQYSFPNVSTRSYLVNSGGDVLLFYNSYEKNIADCIRISKGNSAFADGLFFTRWFTIYNEGTWYITCNEDTVSDRNFTDMYISGGNDPGPSTENGMTFIHLLFNQYIPHSSEDLGISAMSRSISNKLLNTAWNSSDDTKVKSPITNYIDSHDLGLFYFWTTSGDAVSVGAPTEASYHYFAAKVNSTTAIIFAASMTRGTNMVMYAKQLYGGQWATNWMPLSIT